MKNSIKNVVVLSILSGAVLLTAFAAASCTLREDNSDEQPGAPEQEQTIISEQGNLEIPEMQIISSTEDGDWIIVETNYGVFHYPSAFSDIIRVEAINQATSAQIQFLMQTDESDIVVYSIHYNDADNENGIPCGKLKLSEDTSEIAVSVVFENAPKKLSDDWAATFYAVQETFNDVIFSMSEDNRFASVE